MERRWIPASRPQRIGTTFGDLQKRRQTSREFETKQGSTLLGDLLRSADRDRKEKAEMGNQYLAEAGFTLLERTREVDDKEVLEVLDRRGSAVSTVWTTSPS